MHRFFSAHLNTQSSDYLTLTDPKELHHLKTVLRLKKDDVLSLFNGKGTEIEGTISEVSSHQVTVKVTAQRHAARGKNRVFVILACAIPKKAKFEFIIEKCTELGVDEIIPLKTRRTEVILTKEKGEKKVSRYQTVAINAAKQSQRATVPEIQPPLDFKEALKRLTPEYAGFIPCLAGERKNLNEALKLKPGQTKVIFFIGPEGDFTPEEVSLAIKAGCVPVSLGDNVLKVDTAAISVLAFTHLLNVQPDLL